MSRGGGGGLEWGPSPRAPRSTVARPCAGRKNQTPGDDALAAFGWQPPRLRRSATATITGQPSDHANRGMTLVTDAQVLADATRRRERGVLQPWALTCRASYCTMVGVRLNHHSQTALLCGGAMYVWSASGVVQPLTGSFVLPSVPAPLPTYLRAFRFDPADRHDPGIVPSATLQSCVAAAVHRLGLDARVRAGDLGVALADLTRTPATPAFAGLNVTRMVYGASVPKIATLAAAFQLRHDVRAGRAAPDAAMAQAVFGHSRDDPARAEFTPAFRESLRLSIYRSDNRAATAALDALGHAYIAAFLWHAGLYDPREGGGLWVGVGFGRGTTRWRSDPVGGLPHAATPLALVRFYALLGQDRLVDAEASREVRVLMADSAFYNRFRQAVLARYPTANVYRKTGTVFPWRHDSALVERPGARYAIAGLCRGDDCSQRLVELGAALDDCVGR
jgi:hypothetical protein